jgi:hypothetical protein
VKTTELYGFDKVFLGRPNRTRQQHLRRLKTISLSDLTVSHLLANNTDSAAAVERPVPPDSARRHREDHFIVTFHIHHDLSLVRLIECFISAPGLVRSTKARIDFFVLLSFQEGSVSRRLSQSQIGKTNASSNSSSLRSLYEDSSRHPGLPRGSNLFLTETENQLASAAALVGAFDESSSLSSRVRYAVNDSSLIEMDDCAEANSRQTEAHLFRQRRRNDRAECLHSNYLRHSEVIAGTRRGAGNIKKWRR